MDIKEAHYEGGELKLKVYGRDALRFVYTFKPGEYEIVRQKKKRSLDANAYCWKLCDEIAKAVGITKEEVYRNSIRDVGVFDQLHIAPEAVEAFGRRWGARGIGWTIDIADEGAGKTLVFAYYGSSVYDTKEMSRLIDNLVQECVALDIETLSERELSLLKEEWSAQKD